MGPLLYINFLTLHKNPLIYSIIKIEVKERDKIFVRCVHVSLL